MIFGLFLFVFATGCDESTGSSVSNGDEELEVETEDQFTIEEVDLVQYVDPMIGTQGSGNTVPGPSMPHGMVKLSPDTHAEAGSIDAYDYGHEKIDGFSHTHLEGPGGSGNGYSQILFMPRVGDVAYEREDYASVFTHDSEQASPGYYTVTLEDSKVRVELTAARRAGYHRYTFPASSKAHVLVDLGYSRGDSVDGHFEIVNETTIQGFGTYCVHPLIHLMLGEDGENTAISTVYFYAVFDKTFSSYGTWNKENDPALNPGSNQETGKNIGGYVQFDTEENEVVQVQVGISFIDVEHARLNLLEDIGESSFEEVHQQTRQTWNSLLNRIQVEGGTDTDKTVFYTALYHSLLQPADSTEVGGDFYTAASGDDSVTTADTWHYFTDDWCMWDTYRTSHPLGTLIEPEIRSDIVRSMLHWYQEGGWLPKCTWHANGYSRIMIGNHAVPIIVDAYMKGLRDYDESLAYEAVRKSAMEDNENVASESMCGYFNLGTTPSYIEKGYVPNECDGTQSVSMTLEYAYNDWCTAQFAKAQDRDEDYTLFMERSQNFRNTWNPDVGFMQRRLEDGSWLEPFDPEFVDDFNGFCEASSWVYSWFVPHAVPDLMELVGGDQAFVERLDTYFDSGFHDPTNQPGFHVPFLYHFANQPQKSVERVESLLNDHFGAGPNGLPGNDDSGAMSAWYVLGALGLYPVAPSDPTWQIVAPRFDRIVLYLHPQFYTGETFVIEKETGETLSAQWNGEPLAGMSISHSEIAKGGVLTVQVPENTK